MSSDTIIVVSATTLNSILSLLVYTRNPKRPTNIAFTLFGVSITLWTVFNYLADHAPSLNLFYTNLTLLFGSYIMVSLVFLGIVFPTRLHVSKSLIKRLLLITAINSALCLLNVYVPEVTKKVAGGVDLKTGMPYYLYVLFLLYFLCLGVFYLFKQLRTSKGVARVQLKLFLAGILVYFVFAFASNIFLPMFLDDWSSSRFGPIFTIPFVAITAYAIVKQRMFDIRLVIARTFAYTITISVVAVVYSLFALLVATKLVSFEPFNTLQLLVLVLPVIFIALTFNSISKLIAQGTRRLFYHDSYELRLVLDTLSDTLLAANEIDDIMHRSLQVITDAIKSSHSYFAVFDDTDKPYHELAIDRSPPRAMKGLIQIAHEFHTNLIVRDTIYDRKVPEIFESEDASLILLLGDREKPTALIIFGPKQNGRIYTSTDIDLLRISAKNLEVALDNAKKYEQISRFADTLRTEVDHATEKLQRVNTRLKSLDVLKNDFMSMASHQLRSPATSVYEALHMLNHPALSAKDREELTALAEANSERLVTVVRTMLNMARLQAGRFTIDRSEEDIVALAEKVLMQTGIVAEARHVTLHLKKPHHEIKAWVDAAKIVEAMANYVENAIKYSPEKSRVEVELRVEGKKIVFEVKDSGMGVPVAERKDLFGKFYRATNAREEEPDGNGIGLYVVRNIAHGHGGDAYYAPRKPGSLFGFWVPLQHS